MRCSRQRCWRIPGFVQLAAWLCRPAERSCGAGLGGVAGQVAACTPLVLSGRRSGCGSAVQLPFHQLRPQCCPRGAGPQARQERCAARQEHALLTPLPYLARPVPGIPNLGHASPKTPASRSAHGAFARMRARCGPPRAGLPPPGPPRAATKPGRSPAPPLPPPRTRRLARSAPTTTGSSRHPPRWHIPALT